MCRRAAESARGDSRAVCALQQSRPRLYTGCMPALGPAPHHPHRNVRLDTLVRLRWLAIIRQTTAVFVVYYGLDFELPIYACLGVIALAAWLNVVLRLRFHITQRLEADRAASAAGIRYSRAGGAAVPDGRIAESLCIPFSRSGSTLGNSAAAPFHVDSRRLC